MDSFPQTIHVYEITHKDTLMGETLLYIPYSRIVWARGANRICYQPDAKQSMYAIIAHNCREPYILHLNIALSMVVSPDFAGKRHVSNGCKTYLLRSPVGLFPIYPPQEPEVQKNPNHPSKPPTTGCLANNRSEPCLTNPSFCGRIRAPGAWRRPRMPGHKSGRAHRGGVRHGMNL